MAGFIRRNYKTVVMDGSNEEVLKDIINGIETATKGEAKCYPLDDDHPTMMIIETRTCKRIYDVIQSVVEFMYPGLCVFNPKI